MGGRSSSYFYLTMQVIYTAYYYVSSVTLFFCQLTTCLLSAVQQSLRTVYCITGSLSLRNNIVSMKNIVSTSALLMCPRDLFAIAKFLLTVVVQ